MKIGRSAFDRVGIEGWRGVITIRYYTKGLMILSNSGMITNYALNGKGTPNTNDEILWK